jgi:hypothetical protein
MYSAMFLMSDLILAMMPIHLVTTILIHRPIREKIILCILMSLGLVCTGAVVPKLISLSRYSQEAMDPTWYLCDVFLWTAIEMWLAIIVACVPPMRNAFEGLLKRLNLVTESDPDSAKVNFAHGSWTDSAEQEK